MGVLAWSLKRKVVPSQGLEKTWKMQPGDLVPTFRGLACLAGDVHHFDSTTLNGLYTVLVFYEGDFLPVSASFLRALATTLEGHCYLVAVSTDSVEAHREFAATSLKGFNIPLVEDKTGEICRNFGVLDLTSHTAVPTTFILDEEGELMASFSTTTKVGGSAEEVLRVVAACKECDSSNAWSLPRGTTAVGQTQDSCLTSDIDIKKPTAKAEEKKEKEKKEANAMDDIQP